MLENNSKGEYDDDDEGTGSSGGQSGHIEFHDFINPGAERDDLLPPDQIRRILAEHAAQHTERVQKQKNLRDDYKAVKQGKKSLQVLREGKGSGLNATYLPHPKLSLEAQFSGIDKEVSPNPSDNMADTNEADRNELENQYRLQHAPKFQPKFNPKPQFNK
jgi:hypothetical protein